uniref:Odorant receptor n=1 Tax=Campoletis chlorideae TaxID=219166 RepID=A0A346D440_9HYME|nr:odorant receptor [Campoletis chlorideae]
MLLSHSWSFTMLQLCGLSRPRQWFSGWKKYFYNSLTIFSSLCIYVFTLTGLVKIITSPSFGEAARSSFMALTMFGVSCKIANWILRSNDIIIVMEILNNDVCRPRGNEELAIQTKFDNLSRTNTMFFGGIAEGIVIDVTITSLLENIAQRTLPFPAWFPFDCTSDWKFWIAFLHQILAHGIAANIGTFHDTFFHEIMIQARAKLNILKFRLRSIPEAIEKPHLKNKDNDGERKKSRLYSQLQEEIYKFVKKSNEVFNIVLLVQFSVSAFVICMSTYMLSKLTIHSPEFIFIVVYLLSMILQIFLMCWHGNEVIVESMDVRNAIYDMDWCSLGPNSKKDLHLMMTRTYYRLEYTTSHLITLSLESYNSLLKLSYSMYNLLQTST